MQTRLDGIVLRGAREEDLEQVLELTEARGGPEDLPEARAAFTHGEGYRQFYGAFDGDRLVAVLSLWQEDIRLGSSHLPAGQMDFVATATDYEHRGLARDLVAIAHQVSAERGDIVQILVGIPYFNASEKGAKEGELTFVSGNPGRTSRGLTIAELELQRDVALPKTLMYLSELRQDGRERTPEHAVAAEEQKLHA